MGSAILLESPLIAAARQWVVRLTSGDMTECELERFLEWRSIPEHGVVFATEIANWRKLGQLREALAPTIKLPTRSQAVWRRITGWLDRD
ncbi:DUF4880 domain-containing protein [Sphingobium yanoikuyae]|jgi:ferric-dicitrate binding protein FerR (iron transport regulator)|uniref:DUF4880 domain-containing protein n=1 Tax=Sphingobium yanoikuyae TaxID=13690 RepID=UPI0004E35CFD|nr:DUF4880 domain-containing protein [Sphingobium yanoikuyae]KFD26756.1 hypothetical protein IH86_18630 [Sphingobium yanoikuyae]MDV3482019.1 DUF4880 domain-containing protein [Sphingobium yanoikuyae]